MKITVTILTLLTAAILTGAVWTALDFEQADVISGTSYPFHPRSGFTIGQFVSILFATLLFPAGMWLLGLLMSIVFKMNHWSRLFRIPFAIALIIASIYTVIALTNNWGWDLLRCGIVACVGYDEANTLTEHQQPVKNGYQALSAILLVILSFIIAFVSFVQLICMLMVQTPPVKESISDLEEELLYERELERDLFYIEIPQNNHLRTSKRYETCAIVLFLVIYLPFLLFVSSYLPNSWDTWTSAKASNAAATRVTSVYSECEALNRRENIGAVCPEKDGAVFRTGSWKLNDNVILKFFPDLLIFYGFLYAISLVGLTTRLIPGLHIIMHKRPWIFQGANVLQFIIFLMFSIAMIFEIIYWSHDHNYQSSWPGRTVAWQEIMSRMFGQIANFVMGLLVFPTSRTSVFNHILGMPWEMMIKFHVILGYILLATLLCHMTFWWRCYDILGMFPHDIFAVPMYYPNDGRPLSMGPTSDNFTIQIGTLAYFLMLLCMGLFGLNYIRRRYFELFYYSHHVFLFIFLAALWHATSSWYFLIPGLSMWLVDRVIRFFRGLKEVQDVKLEILEDKYTKISFRIPGFQYHAGNYVFLNVPEISLLQWHPFTLCSIPSEDMCYIIVKNMGSGTFTGDLLRLADKKGSPPMICIDGPYGGQRIDPNKYDSIVFVAGGVGITPCHSLFGSLFMQSQFNGKLDLLWVSKDATLLRRLPLLQDLARENAERAHVRVFLTSEKGYVKVENNEQIAFQNGRPNIHDELVHLSIPEVINEGGRCLLFVCGPAGLVSNCLESARKLKLECHYELFEL